MNEDLFSLTILGIRNRKYLVDGMTYGKFDDENVQISFDCVLTKDFKLFSINEIEIYKGGVPIKWSRQQIAKNGKRIRSLLEEYLRDHHDSILTNNWGDDGVKLTVLECEKNGIKFV